MSLPESVFWNFLPRFSQKLEPILYFRLLIQILQEKPIKIRYHWSSAKKKFEKVGQFD